MEEGTALTHIWLYNCLCDCTESAFHYLAKIINLQLFGQPSGPVTLPSLLFPPFLLRFLCIIPFCSLFSFLSLTHFLFTFHSLPLAHRGYSIVYTSTNFDYFQGEMSYLCVVFISSYVSCLQLCNNFLLCSYFVVVNDTLMAISSTVHLTPFSISSVAFIA